MSKALDKQIKAVYATQEKFADTIISKEVKELAHKILDKCKTQKNKCYVVDCMSPEYIPEGISPEVYTAVANHAKDVALATTIASTVLAGQSMNFKTFEKVSDGTWKSGSRDNVIVLENSFLQTRDIKTSVEVRKQAALTDQPKESLGLTTAPLNRGQSSFTELDNTLKAGGVNDLKSGTLVTTRSCNYYAPTLRPEVESAVAIVSLRMLADLKLIEILTD